MSAAESWRVLGEHRRGRGSGVELDADIALIYSFKACKILRIEPQTSQGEALTAWRADPVTRPADDEFGCGPGLTRKYSKKQRFGRVPAFRRASRLDGEAEVSASLYRRHVSGLAL